MYAYIKGIIKEIKANYIVIDNNNIGYLILVPNAYVYNVGNTETIYTYHHVREDTNSLYGFNSDKTKELFMKLISVKGIGPKTALSILATDQIDAVVLAIENGDIKLLTKFPGIGMKTAQQIILDLKGKLVDEEELSNIGQLNDAAEALSALGYSKREISKVIKGIDGNLTVQEILKIALQKIVG